MELLDRLFIAHEDKGKKYIDDTVQQAITEINNLNPGDKYKMFEIKFTSNRLYLEALVKKFKQEVMKVFPNIESDIIISKLDETDEEGYVFFICQLLFTKTL
jgi:hypothetical protein